MTNEQFHVINIIRKPNEHNPALIVRIGSIDIYDKSTQLPLTTQTIQRGSEVTLGAVKIVPDYVVSVVHEIVTPDSPLLKLLETEHELTRTGLVLHGTVDQNLRLEEIMKQLEMECERAGLRKLKECESYLSNGVYELNIQNLK